MGYRYRLHVRTLPGTPDLVFPSRKAVIFMHGCFWHRHQGCHLARMPKSRINFWREKLEANKLRDKDNMVRLNELGWRVMVIWECQMKEKNLEKVSNMVRQFLDNGTGSKM
jgi:DNA mismatch endonuclease (patch repair protein)